MTGKAPDTWSIDDLAYVATDLEDLAKRLRSAIETMRSIEMATMPLQGDTVRNTQIPYIRKWIGGVRRKVDDFEATHLEAKRRAERNAKAAKRKK